MQITKTTGNHNLLQFSPAVTAASDGTSRHGFAVKWYIQEKKFPYFQVAGGAVTVYYANMWARLITIAKYNSRYAQ